MDQRSLLGVLFRPGADPPPFGRQAPFFAELGATAEALGTGLFCFPPAARLAGRLSGWIWDRGWMPAARPLPSLVFDRFVARSLAERAAHQGFVKAFVRRGVGVFNAPELQALVDDKARFSRWLGELGFPSVPHLSLAQARPQLLAASGGRYFFKPRYGFGGAGIGLCELTAGAARLRWLDGKGAQDCRNREALLTTLERLDAENGVLLSPDTDGPRIAGSVFDIRLLLQRPAPGAEFRQAAVLRLGAPGQPVSNLRRGGKAWPVEALNSVPGLGGLSAELEQRSQDLVSALGDRFGPWAELGLDWLVDREGRPRLLEANAKPARWAFTAVADDSTLPPVLRRRYAALRRESVAMPVRFALALAGG